MSKWDEHKNKFKELNQSTGIGIKDYCVQNNLPYNTARRYLKISDQKDDHFFEEKRRLDAQESPQKQAKEKNKNKLNQEPVEPPRRVISDREDAQQSDDHAQNDQRGNGGDPISTPHRGGISTRFKKGVGYNYKHGLFATPKYQDIAGALEILMDPENIPLLEFEAIKSLTAQKMLIERMQNDSLALFIQQQQAQERAKKNPRQKGSEEEAEDPIPAEFQMLKLVSDTGLSLASVTSSISAMIDRAHIRNQKYRALSLKERESSICRQAYQQLDDDEITPLEAAMFIESHAVKVPALLMKLVEKQLEKMQLSEVIEGVGNENLDDLARKYQETRKQYADSVAGRPEGIDEFLARQGYEGGGDMVPQFQQVDDEDSIDRDAVKGLYGDE